MMQQESLQDPLSQLAVVLLSGIIKALCVTLGEIEIG